MHAADEKTLQKIRELYVDFLNQKNTALKSAYLAVSACGFTNILKSGRDKVMIEREKDHAFLVCSYPVQPDEIKVVKHDRILRFHTESF